VTVLFGSSPQAPYAQYRLGEAYLKLSDTAAANAAFRKVIDGWGDSSWADQARQRLNGGHTAVPGAPIRRSTPAGGKTVVPPAPSKRAGTAADAGEGSSKTATTGDRLSVLPRPIE
jgi:hypothetical protein